MAGNFFSNADVICSILYYFSLCPVSDVQISEPGSWGSQYKQRKCETIIVLSISLKPSWKTAQALPTLPLQSLEMEVNKFKKKYIKGLCFWGLHNHNLHQYPVSSSLTLNSSWRSLWDHHLLWPLLPSPSEGNNTAAWHKVLFLDTAVSQMYTLPQFSKNNKGQEMLSLTSSPLYHTAFSGISENESHKAISLIQTLGEVG